MATFRQSWGLPFFLFMCLTLGGASAAGFIANAVLQLLAITVIVGLLWNRQFVATTGPSWSFKPISWILGIAVLWIILQLIPLPPSIWQLLPGREFVTYGDRLLGMEGVWRPISLQPSQTLTSAMSIMPALAALLLTLRAPPRARILSIWVIVVIGIISAFLGIIQIFQTSAQGAYFYKVTNYGASVGFFANANHLATLFLIGLILSSELPFTRKQNTRGQGALWALVKWSLVTFFAVNIVVNGSVAGIGLLLLVSTYIILRLEYLRAAIGKSKFAIVGIGVIVSLVAGAFIWKFSGSLSTFAQTSVPGEDRLEFTRNTIRMIADSFPVGYGLGSFRETYLGYENLRTVTMTFVNHAHNDYLEFLSDFGIPALAIVGLYAIWFGRRVKWMWTTRVSLETYHSAAAMIIVIVAAHSFVDYPLRTSAIAAIFAFATGCLADPRAEGEGHPVRSRSLN